MSSVKPFIFSLKNKLESLVPLKFYTAANNKKKKTLFSFSKLWVLVSYSVWSAAQRELQEPIQKKNSTSSAMMCNLAFNSQNQWHICEREREKTNNPHTSGNVRPRHPTVEFNLNWPDATEHRLLPVCGVEWKCFRVTWQIDEDETGRRRSRVVFGSSFIFFSLFIYLFSARPRLPLIPSDVGFNFGNGWSV